MLPIDLKGKVAVVTGCTQGIGLGIARVMAKAGCDIAGCGLSDESSAKAIRFVNQIKQEGRKAFYKKCDVRSETDINLFVDEVLKEYGKIDFLVSNAGINMFTSPESCPSSFWDDNMDLNLKSHWMISKACYPHLKQQKGVILLMTSNHAFSTIPDCFPYNVSKSGIDGLVRALAVQWSADVRVIGIAPGFIDTEGGEEWFNAFPDPEKKKEEVLGIHPTRKLGTVEEVGALCSFLCSEYAGFITGTTYLIDGGRSAIMQDI
jgi:NAD(P)-dependent dehydrogenase (short-subunit alcohol dehydrogenase family)